MPIYDLTIEISPETTVFPGDPVFRTEAISEIKHGSTFALSHFHFSNHTGTHIDFPAHLIAKGKTSSAYPLEQLVGAMQVIEVPGDEHVTLRHVESLNPKDGTVIFFKTNNSRVNLHNKPYTESFIAIEPSAAEELVRKGFSIVGIDYLSVDRTENKELPTHHCLLSNDILIIENLDLRGIPAGKYHVIIAPLKVKEADGLPVRVIASEVDVFSYKKEKFESGSSSPETSLPIVLVDDNRSLTMAWELDAANAEIELSVYNNAEKFKRDLYKLDKNTIIYMDIHLGEKYTGVELSQWVYKQGFKNIFLITADNLDDYRNLEWVKGVLGKSPPFLYEK